MPTPLFNFRLPKNESKALREVAQAYNGGNVSALLREVVGAIVSGDPQRIAEFNARLVSKLTGQLTLEFLQDTARRSDPVAGTRKRGERRAAAARTKRKGARRRVRKP